MSVPLILLLAAIELSSGAGATSEFSSARCPLLLLARQPHLPREAHRLFLRDPGASVWSRTYIHNVALGLRRVFAPWFEAGREPFEIILRRQHAYTVYGGDRFRGHGRAYTGDIKFSPRPWAGRLRRDLAFDLPPLNLSASHRDSDAPYARQTPIPGIPSAAWTLVESPKSFRGRPVVRVTFAGKDDQRFFVGRMSGLMSQLRALPIDAGDEVVRLLAAYYYVGVHAHAFYRVNNSLLMAQVNFILNRHGRPGVPHAHLDREALVSRTYEDFEARFAARVAAAAAAINSTGSPTRPASTSSARR